MRAVEVEIRRLASIVDRLTPPMPTTPAPPHIYTGDHDLLVGLVETVRNLKDSVDKLLIREDTHVTKDLLGANVIEANKIHDDHELRIRSVEMGQTRTQTWGAALVIALSIAQFFLNHLWK